MQNLQQRTMHRQNQQQQPLFYPQQTQQNQQSLIYAVPTINRRIVVDNSNTQKQVS